MKTHLRFASLFLLVATLLILGSTAAMAGNTVVYNNGAPNFNDAWTINFNYWVEDSFTLAQAGNLTRINFAAGLFPGDKIQSVQWTIFSTGTTHGFMRSGTATVSSLGSCGTDCEEESFALPNLQLPAGTYFLRLQNAVVPTGDPAYWWESGGASKAYESNQVGTIPSESFEVIDPPLAANASPPGQSSHSDSTVALLGSAFLGLAGIAWRVVKL